MKKRSGMAHFLKRRQDDRKIKLYNWSRHSSVELCALTILQPCARFEAPGRYDIWSIWKLFLVCRPNYINYYRTYQIILSVNPYFSFGQLTIRSIRSWPDLSEAFTKFLERKTTQKISTNTNNPIYRDTKFCFWIKFQNRSWWYENLHRSVKIALWYRLRLPFVLLKL